MHNYVGVYLSLLQCNCSIDVCDSSGNTPLHYCSRAGAYRIASFLVAQGADVNIRNKSGESPLDWAELGKHNDIVELPEKAMLEGPHGMLIACFQLHIIPCKLCCLGQVITPPIHSHSTESRHPQFDHQSTIMLTHAPSNQFLGTWQLQVFFHAQRDSSTL